MNTQSDKLKLAYLYAFEELFRAKCKDARINPARWSQGMWVNAHAAFGQSTDIEHAVNEWLEHVKKYSKFFDSEDQRSSFIGLPENNC